ncbi:hypothetical protein R3W88_026785 [Solanum pinnatisectum]|uniref:Uncharacterized protein n=1 Tax=Solanum pinnatisectum TaxID=50273 RepID=A0AAV9LEG0_9SOLN|nr:hypothetical protein R3W88_026785 [Solanum pinnatisectum]
MSKDNQRKGHNMLQNYWNFVLGSPLLVTKKCYSVLQGTGTPQRANQCLKPLSHTSKLLIGMELDVPGLVACLKEGLADPINYVSRSALARVLFLYERDSIQIFHSLGEAEVAHWLNSL